MASSFLQSLQPQQSLVQQSNFINPNTLLRQQPIRMPNSSMIGGTSGYINLNDPTSNLYSGGVKPPESAFNMGDYLKYGQSAVNIGSGLMGLYGQYNANQRADEAMGIARANHQLNVDASNQYKEFRNNTKSAFA